MLVDFDDPAVLVAEGLRPSGVATGRRPVTQASALAQFERHPEAAGLRWWSTLEASWLQITRFDRSLETLALRGLQELKVDHEEVRRAAAHLGLQ